MSRSSKNCIICAESATNMRKHAFECHLPYFWSPFSACFTCQEQLGSVPRLKKMHLDVHLDEAYQFRSLRNYMGRVLSFFHKLSWELTQSADLTILLDLVIKKQWYPEKDLQRIDFTHTELALLVPFQKLWEEEDVEPQVSPPNGLTSLLHWRIIVSLLAQLSKERQALLKNWNESEMIPILRMPITDAHFHLDMLKKSTQLTTFRKIETAVTFGTELLPLTCAIANYVYPSSWSQISDVDEDDRLYFTVGLHPHMTDHTVSIPFLLDFLKHPKCVGIGEIGLDYTSTCRCRNHKSRYERERCQKEKHRRQEAFLDSLLPQLRTRDCTIVIHTNGEGADLRMIDLLREFGLNNHRVHWHCFTGSKEIAILIQDVFPHAKFSFSSRSISEDQVLRAIPTISLEAIVLETDAPYLDSFKQRLNTPWTVTGNAKVVARIKNVPFEVMLIMAQRNLQELYRLPKSLSISPPSPVQPLIFRDCFQGPRCLLSNMYPCSIQFKGQAYNSSEQAYQHQRALDINPSIAKKILSADGMKSKALSKQLSRVQRIAWNEKWSIPLIKDLLKAKAEQVPEFKEVLTASEGRYLLEATYDRFWGVGVSKEQAAASPLADLPGRNVLGWLLMQLRNQYNSRPMHCLQALYQAHPGVPFYEGIAFVFGEIPFNRD